MIERLFKSLTRRQSTGQHYAFGGTSCVETGKAFLEYYFDPVEGVWNVQNINSRVRGEGKKVVRLFAKKIGVKQRVRFCTIIEEDTRKRLLETGVSPFVESTRRTIILKPNPALFKTLKMVRVIEGGGLKIEGIELSYVPDRIDVEKEETKIVSPRVNMDIYCRT